MKVVYIEVKYNMETASLVNIHRPSFYSAVDDEKSVEDTFVSFDIF